MCVWVSSHRWWLALVVFWSLEVWAVQELTLAPTLWSDEVMVIKDKVYRLCLNLLACGTLASLLGWRALSLVFAGSVVFYGVVVAYWLHYGQAISVFIAFGSRNEGAAVATAGIELVGGHLVVLSLLAVAKSLLARHVALDPRPATFWRPRRAGVLAFAYAAFVLVLHVDHKDMARIGRWETVSGIGHAYGYLPTWGAELLWVNREAVLERTLARMELASDRLGALEPAPPLNSHVVFLQVESLDDALLGFRIGESEVTPRLNRLRDEGMYWTVRAPKIIGSCDTDFTALMGRLGSADVPSYRIEGIPWQEALPKSLAARGFRPAAYHGVSGSFFQRAPVYRQMGFEGVWFKEEIVARLGLDFDDWTLPDGDVLQFAAQDWDPSRRNFQMIITATSHLPFRFPTPGLERIFFGEDAPAIESYFDSMRYVDHSIGNYLDALPDGTTVVVYGDHGARIENPALDYTWTEYDGTMVVPFFVWQKGVNLSARQQTRELPMARSGELELLDMMTWLHRHLVALPVSAPPATLASP